jgi:hypothetical protein
MTGQDPVNLSAMQPTNPSFNLELISLKNKNGFPAGGCLSVIPF